MVMLTTGFLCRVTLSNEPGYKASYSFTSNLLTIPLKHDNFKFLGPKRHSDKLY